jgi:Ulp1 family protease
VSIVIMCTFYFTYSIQHKDIYVDSINKCSFHWILIVFDLSDGHLLIYDSLRKPQEDYQDMIDIIQG